MNLLKAGNISCRLFSLTTDADTSLDQLGEALSGVGGNFAGEYGWGSISDPINNIGSYGVSEMQCGLPEVLPEDEEQGYPERLLGRFYWRQVDARVARIIQEEEEGNASERLDAIDFLISKHRDGEFLVATTSRNLDVVRSHFQGQMIVALEGGDIRAQMQIDTSPRGDLEPDFFFWLMYRCHHAPDLSDDISLVDLVRIAGQDVDRRGSRVTDGATLDRVELLSMIMSGSTSFGPATISVDHGPKGLSSRFEIYPDGGFNPATTTSSYEERELRSRDILGERLTQDLLYVILPGIIDTFTEDLDWRQGLRDGYVQAARDLMMQVLADLQNA